jgi:Flavoprotein
MPLPSDTKRGDVSDGFTLAVEPPSATACVAAGGAIETSLLPYYFVQLLSTYPHLRLRAALSRKAQQFVSVFALDGLLDDLVYTEDRPYRPQTAIPFHLDLASSDLLVIFPATARIIAECALGIVTCPVTRLFAFTAKDRVVLVPYLHPLISDQLYLDHLERMQRIGVTVLRPTTGLVWTGESAWDTARLTLCRRLGLDPDVRPQPSYEIAFRNSREPAAR